MLTTAPIFITGDSQMLIETLSNTKLLISVFKSHLNFEEKHTQKLNVIARKSGFKSWSGMNEFLKSSRVAQLDELMVDAISKEKKAVGLFPAPFCLFDAILTFSLYGKDEKFQLEVLRLLNLFSYVAFHGAFNTVQQCVREQPLFEIDERPCLMVGYDLTQCSIANLHNQLVYSFLELPQLTSSLTDDYILDSDKLIQIIIKMDQRVFRDGDKTKAFLPVYWDAFMKEKKRFFELMASPRTSLETAAIEVNIYNDNEIQEATDLDVEEYSSFSFLLMPLNSGSFGLIKNVDSQGAPLEYDSQEILDITEWCAGDFILTPSLADLPNPYWTVTPHG